MKPYRLLVPLVAAFFLGTGSHLTGAGFALIEQSVTAMGNAYAGAAATAEDASTIFFNPAGMAKLPTCQQALLGAHFIFPSAKFKDEGSVYILGGPLTGGDGGDGGEFGLVGHLYYARYLDCGLWLGLGINTPFGLATDYNDTWKGRYHAIKSELLTININPAFAYRFNDCFSIGAGFNAMYLDAELTNAVDFGLILFQETMGMLGTPQEQDGKAKVKGDSWGFGGNVGFLWEPRCGTRLGVHYRSEVRQNVEGHVKYTDVPPLLAGTFFNTSAKSDVTLPSILSFSAYHQINPCLFVVADASWTRWKTINRLVFKFKQKDGMGLPEAVTTLKWQNSWRYSVGATYKINACWTARTGFAYDQTPVPDRVHRTPRIPDEDRYWLAIGGSYHWLDCVTLDAGYAHLFIPDPKIDKSNSPLEEDKVKGGLKGKYDAHTDIVSFQARVDF